MFDMVWNVASSFNCPEYNTCYAGDFHNLLVNFFNTEYQSVPLQLLCFSSISYMLTFSSENINQVNMFDWNINVTYIDSWTKELRLSSLY